LLLVNSQEHGKLLIRQVMFLQLITYRLYVLIHKEVCARLIEIHCSVLIEIEDLQVYFLFSYAKNYEILFHTNQLNILKVLFTLLFFLSLKILEPYQIEYE
jgi:hypothetical protein